MYFNWFACVVVMDYGISNAIITLNYSSTHTFPFNNNIQQLNND